MGTATLTIRIDITGIPARTIVENTFDVLSSELILPLSMELHLPGARRYTFPTPPERDCDFGEENLSDLLPDEEYPINARYSTCRATGSSSLVHARQEILAKVDELQAEARDRMAKEKTANDEVYWTFWGLTRIAQRKDCGGLIRDWLLRERLIYYETLVPICRVRALMS